MCPLGLNIMVTLTRHFQLNDWVFNPPETIVSLCIHRERYVIPGRLYNHNHVSIENTVVLALFCTRTSTIIQSQYSSSPGFSDWFKSCYENYAQGSRFMCTLGSDTGLFHDDVTKWKHFPRYWPLVRGIHGSPVNSPHKAQWRGALMFSLICVWINGWVNNREAGDLSRYRAYTDVTVMLY